MDPNNFNQDIQKYIQTEIFHSIQDPNQLITEPPINLNNQTIQISNAKMSQLNIFTQNLDHISYDNIGGYRKQIALIRQIIQISLRHPQLTKALGIKMPRSILLYGPSGSGKTLLARAIANESGMFFFLINGSQIMSKIAGQAEQSLRKAVQQAEKNCPAIIFIDSLDLIAPNRQKVHGEIYRRLVSQLLAIMDDIKIRRHVIVIAATNRPNLIDPALRRYGRFDKQIEIGVPDEIEKLQILRIHTKNMKLSENVILQDIVKETRGYIGADIAYLCTQAAFQCIRQKMNLIDIADEKIEAHILQEMVISQQHFEFAQGIINPSSLRENYVQIPNVKWEDIGVSQQIKKHIKQIILLPIQHSQKFIKFGVQQPSKGFLFYGPPGCGKALLAKAIANQFSANFISIKCSQLLKMEFGQSEANLRDIFDKARISTPCVLFFDQLESLTQKRQSLCGDAGYTIGNRIINQLMRKIDGMERKKNILLIGATNRPDLDQAIFKPGRLDQLIYIPLPDQQSRQGILKVNLRKIPIAKDIDFDVIAQSTAGLTGADLANICQKAAKLMVRNVNFVFLSVNRIKNLNCKRAKIKQFRCRFLNYKK